MAYKVLDIYKDLPRTNCGDCGKGSCFAFASAVYLEAFPLEACSPLDPAVGDAMQAKLEEGREAGEGRRPASGEQALRALLSVMREVDLAVQADRSGGNVVEGPEEGIRLDFLGDPYQITRAGVTPLAGTDPPVSVKILLLIYVTRATGRRESGSWAAFRDLPNTVSKSKSFEESAARVAGAFAGRSEDLGQAARMVGGEAVESGAAARAFRIAVLPRVPFLLLFWDSEEEFPARASFLLDRGVLDYLDQEAIVFAAEALTACLLGEGLDGLVA